MARLKKTPTQLREEARRLIEVADRIEQEKYVKVGKAFEKHIVHDFKEFDLATFTKEARKILGHE